MRPNFQGKDGLLLRATKDPEAWAKEFCYCVEHAYTNPGNEQNMTVWFTSALKAGYLHGQKAAMEKMSDMVSEATKDLIAYK